MILVDNSVEQAIKTYLSLPRRVTGLSISRKRLAEVTETFPCLLDALEEYASSRLGGIDLGAIEWYHRMRNELYHQGMGLTVERDKVALYSELAALLLYNLFGVEIPRDATAETEKLGKLIVLWNRLEVALKTAGSYHVLEAPRQLGRAIEILKAIDGLSHEETRKIHRFRQIRNVVVHAQPGFREFLTDSIISELEDLVGKVEKDLALLGDNGGPEVPDIPQA